MGEVGMRAIGGFSTDLRVVHDRLWHDGCDLILLLCGRHGELLAASAVRLSKEAVRRRVGYAVLLVLRSRSGLSGWLRLSSGSEPRG